MKYKDPEVADASEIMKKFALSYKKFRFDLKNFMIARDKRGIGALSEEEFI